MANQALRRGPSLAAAEPAVPATTLYHSSHEAFPNDKPEFDAFFGDADFQKTFPHEFGEHTYGVDLPGHSKILDLNTPSPEAHQFMADMAKHAFPKDPAYAEELLKEGVKNGAGHDDFYDMWTDKNNIHAALKDSGYEGVKYNGEYLLPKSTTAALPGKKLAADVLPSTIAERASILDKLGGDDKAVWKKYPTAPKPSTPTDDEVHSALQSLKAQGRLNSDGTVTVWHATTIDDPTEITSKGLVPGASPAGGQDWKATHSDYATYFHLDKDVAMRDVEYGGHVIEARIPVTSEMLKRIIPDEDTSMVPDEGRHVLVHGGGAIAVIGGLPKALVKVVK